MPFPDADRAIVTQEKICDYLLNHNHPVGGAKADWFRSLGYTLNRWHELRDDLHQLAQTCEDFVAVPSPLGVKYVTKGVIGRGEFRAATVLAIWIIEGERFSPVSHRLSWKSIMINITEHSLVVLKRERATEKLSAGDIGAVAHVYEGGKGYEVEFVDGKGITVALLTLEADEVRPLERGELLHARRRS